jgi:superfamily II DNA helicase RecQ
MPETELIGYPRGVRRGSGRPPQELEEIFDRLKVVRNDAADAIGLPRGTLMANAVLIGIAKAAPRDRDELLAVDGMRRWKADVLGDRLLEVVQRG